jgi:oxygen-independent coproporphyrinogen-3 oxidase
VSDAIPLSLYVHFPWCVRKCPYCDFNSHPQKGELPETRYVEALLADFDAELAHADGRSIGTIFFGGGTPSLFSGAAIHRLLAGLRARASIAPDAEITLEANPGAVDAQRFDAYRCAGVNRISIGAQSFDADALARLGRIHAPGDIERAVRAARAAGFERINLDLMHGLPQQTQDAALADLERAIALGVEHLSWYQLTIEPRTAFAANPPLLPDDETLDDIERAGLAVLAQAGFVRYEVSAYARPGAAARHNLNYWSFGDYVGIGAGAHGKLTEVADDVLVERTEKPKAPERYLGTPTGALRRARRIEAGALPGEFMMNVLRLTEGVEASLYERRTGLPSATIEAVRSRLIGRGLIRADRIALTPLGRRYLDSVVAEFV